MKSHVIKLSRAAVAAAIVSTPLGLRADAVTDWNLLAVEVSKAQAPFSGAALNTNLASRILAIESIAVYNGANSILQFGAAYGGNNTPATQPASPEAAIAQAAHDMLVNYFPTQQTVLDQQLATSLGTIANGAAKTNGIAAGAAAAAHIIALRASNGSSPNVSYNGPGAITQFYKQDAEIPVNEAGRLLALAHNYSLADNHHSQLILGRNGEA